MVGSRFPDSTGLDSTFLGPHRTEHSRTPKVVKVEQLRTKRKMPGKRVRGKQQADTLAPDEEDQEVCGM